MNKNYRSQESDVVQNKQEDQEIENQEIENQQIENQQIENTVLQTEKNEVRTTLEENKQALKSSFLAALGDKVNIKLGRLLLFAGNYGIEIGKNKKEQSIEKLKEKLDENTSNIESLKKQKEKVEEGFKGKEFDQAKTETVRFITNLMSESIKEYRSNINQLESENLKHKAEYESLDKTSHVKNKSEHTRIELQEKLRGNEQKLDKLKKELTEVEEKQQAYLEKNKEVNLYSTEEYMSKMRLDIIKECDFQIGRFESANREIEKKLELLEKPGPFEKLGLCLVNLGYNAIAKAKKL